MEHAMHYRAGSSGFSSIGIPDGPPHWYCRCGEWSFIARPNVTRQSGNNLIEAQEAWEQHRMKALEAELE